MYGLFDLPGHVCEWCHDVYDKSYYQASPKNNPRGPVDGKEYVLGAFSIPDAALFYVEFWGAARLKMELPPNCAAHYARMCARPAVQRVFKAERLD